MAKSISIEIGFTGGGSTGVSMSEEKLEAFTKAVTSNDAQRWYTVESADSGEIIVDVSNIVFIRTGARNRSIGFSHS